MSGQPARNRGTRVLVIVVLAVALVAGCTSGSGGGTTPTSRAAKNAATAAGAVPAGATGPVDAEAWALADRLSAPRYTSDTTAAMVAGLARSGIGTFADASASTPDRPVTGAVSPYRVLDFQAHALAVGTWAGSTFSGSESDMLVPLPSGASGLPTTSELLAGYVAAARSPGAALSRALMAGQNLMDPSTLRFPTVVLVLFASDLATDGGQIAATTAGTPSVADQADADVISAGRFDGGVCSATADWISGMISSFFNSLKAATPHNLPGAIVVAIWNWLVDKAQAFVQHLLSAATDAVLGTIRSIAAAIAAVAEQVASLLPYAVKVVATGATGGATFVLGPEPLPGTFTATVTAGDLPDWPGILADCANVARIKLANFHSVGVPVTWGPLEAPGDPLLTTGAPARVAAVTDATGRSTLAFQTSPDPGDRGGEQLNQVDAMPVAVHRSELDDARQRLTEALLGSIPGLLRPFVTSLFAPYLDSLQSRLNSILDARGRGTAILIYHGNARPTPSPTGPSRSGCPVRAGTYSGTETSTFTEKITTDVATVHDENDGTGPVTVTVTADGSISGRWSEQMHETYDDTAHGVTDRRVTTWAMAGGTITGTACGLRLLPGVLRNLSCEDSIMGACPTAPAKTSPQTLPTFGMPSANTPGHITWHAITARDNGGTIHDAYTITVTGP